MGSLEEKNNVKLKSLLLSLHASRKKVRLHFIAYLQKPEHLNVEFKKAYLCTDTTKICEVRLPHCQSRRLGLKSALKQFRRLHYAVTVPTSFFWDQELPVNNPIRLLLVTDQGEYLSSMHQFRFGRVKRDKYLPFQAVSNETSQLYFRLTKYFNLVAVKRPIEEIERKFSFRFLESKLVCYPLKFFAACFRLLSPRKVNLYFEKFAEKAEEGTYELLQKVSAGKKSFDYFILDDRDPQYSQLLSEKNVIKKYSFRYYFLFFASSNLITTEAPAHINIMRTRNRSFKKAIFRKTHVFLQHGIIYMKNMEEKNCAFVAGKEAEPDFILVSSTKEAEVVAKSLQLPMDRILVTGIPIFDTIQYGHIGRDSEDIVTIMLTWKPYEEHLERFEDSSYCQYTLNLYQELTKYLSKDKIYIVPHPKVKEKMMMSEYADSVYSGKISEVLSKTKLLITDYSSVCYNSFYQGSAVVFYQPDIEKYEKENGPLIPNQDEYIGLRCYNTGQLHAFFTEGIEDGIIDLDYFRTTQHVENYQSINQFHDGKNTDRIVNSLLEHQIL